MHFSQIFRSLGILVVFCLVEAQISIGEAGLKASPLPEHSQSLEFLKSLWGSLYNFWLGICSLINCLFATSENMILFNINAFWKMEKLRQLGLQGETHVQEEDTEMA